MCLININSNFQNSKAIIYSYGINSAGMIYPTDEGNISIYSVNATDNIEINGKFYHYAFYTNLPSNGVYSSDYKRYTDRNASVPSGSNWIAIAHAKSDNPTINKPSLGGIYNELDSITKLFINHINEINKTTS